MKFTKFYMKNNRLQQVLVLALLASTVSGCARKAVIGGDPNLSVLAAGQSLEPERADIVSGVEEYFVGPYDRLVVDVYGIENLSAREIQVDASGRMSFPMAGVVEVTGMTPGEIQTVLTDRLRRAFVRDPQVTVNLKEAVSRVVTVGGEVKRPGLYPVIGRMSLLRAIAKAEGTGEFSQLDDVVVFRTVAGKRYATLYNLEAIRNGAYEDPAIYANDVVMVGDSRTRRLFKDALAILPAIATPLVLVLDRLAN